MAETKRTYSIEARSQVEIPDDWADILRVFQGVKLDLESTRVEIGYFEATEKAIEKVKKFLEAGYFIAEV